MPRSDRRTLARLGGCSRHTGPFCKAGPALARDPRGMAEVPVTAGGRGGCIVADVCKRRHMGTVVGHRGTGAPRGTEAHLDKRRPVPCPATAKVASGIAVTARGQLVTEPEWASGQWAAGEWSHGQENISAVQRATAEAGREPRFPCRDFSVREWSPLPRPLRFESVWRGKKESGGNSRHSHSPCRTASRGEQCGC